MITKFVGMKEFRQNLAKYTELAVMKDVQFIVLRKNRPVLEVKAVDEAKIAMKKLKEELDEASAQFDRGEYYSHEEVVKMLGLE